MAVMPGWLLVIFGVCLVIPLARLVVLILTAVLCLMQPARVRRAASAWKGGKSHRRWDESPAGPSVSCPAPRSGDMRDASAATAEPGEPGEPIGADCGRGLWLAATLADELSITSGPDSTIVSLYMRLE